MDTSNVLKKERNEQIYNMRINGKSFIEIGEYFAISSARARELFLKEERERSSIIYQSDLFKELTNMDAVNGKKTYHVLARAGIRTKEALIPMYGTILAGRKHINGLGRTGIQLLSRLKLPETVKVPEKPAADITREQAEEIALYLEECLENSTFESNIVTKRKGYKQAIKDFKERYLA